jgi:hypothetical protein
LSRSSTVLAPSKEPKLTTRSTKAFLAAVSAALIAVAGLTVVGAGTASASTIDGVATTANPATSAYLASGGSNTQYTLTLPPSAACDGDTASDGYHVWSYLVEKGTNISTLSFSESNSPLPPSSGYGLFDATAEYYGPANTASITGQIIGIPNDFDWGVITADDPSLVPALLYNGGNSGVWEAGLACANSAGALTDNWNTEVTFTKSTSDPNGFVWSAVPGPSGDAVAAISSASSTTFTEGTSGSFTPTATGTPTPTITESGALPAGVTFSGGVLSGDPTVTGTFPITFTATNGIGSPAVQNFTLTVSGGTPIITSVTPGQLPQTASHKVVIDGTGFVSPETVKVSGKGVTVSATTTTATAITFTAKVSATAALGARNVTVSGSSGSVTCTGCLTITAAPTLVSASPAAVATGAHGTVTFTGTGFETGAKLAFSGPATTVKASKITVTAAKVKATITVPSGAPTGAYTVKVTNPDGSSATCTTCFSVIAGPTLTGLSPASIKQGTSKSVTLTGTGFASGAKIKGPTGVTFSTVKVKSATSITAKVTVAVSAPTGTGLAVTVTNSAAGGFGTVTQDLLTVKS